MIAKLQLPEQKTSVSDTADFALALSREQEMDFVNTGSLYLTLVRSSFSYKMDQLWEVVIHHETEKGAQKGMDYSKYRFPTEALKFDRDELNER